jgi:octaprenyl-diphosphate synthase
MVEILLPEELAEVEERLRESLSSEISLVAKLGDYLYRSGGKRLRPTLAILFYRLLGARGVPKALVEMAAALELIHLATLVHDDVLDGSAQRRSRPALWTIWGHRTAVLQGDFVFSRAFSILNRQKARLRLLIVKTVEEILKGELLQEELRWSLPTAEEYFAVVRGKTAALISTACAAGALLGDPRISQERFQAIRQAGLKLGIVYQMTDDLLDIFGDGQLGKPLWRDRDGGWITLPFIRLLERAAHDDKERLCLLLQAEELTAVEREELLRRLQSDKIKESFALEARALVAEAKQLLAGWGEPEYEEALFELMDAMVERDR